MSFKNATYAECLANIFIMLFIVLRTLSNDQTKECNPNAKNHATLMV
jgi:hypothetical protein